MVKGGRIQGVVWDWGDTLMRDIPGHAGPMVGWPHVEAMPGAAAALRALSGLSVRCVATNATESDGGQVAEALDRVDLRTFLTHFLTSSELGVSKPDPRFFEEVSRVLGVPTGALLAVGNDYQKDIIPAKAVGMITILVSPAEEKIEFPAADLVVPSLHDLPDLLGHLLSG